MAPVSVDVQNNKRLGDPSGYLKAVWPDLLVCVFEVWPTGGPGKLSRAPGAGQTSKTHTQKSGQTTFKYPDKRLGDT